MLVLMQAPSSPVVLRFDWPVDVTARIDAEYSWQAEIDDVPTEVSRLSFFYHMHVRSHDEGRRIEYSNHTHVDSAGDLLQALKGVLPAWVPVKIVSHRGSFVRIEEAESASRFLSDVYATHVQGLLAQTPPGLFKEFLIQMASPEALAALTAAEWRDLVGRWLGPAPGETPVERAGDLRIASGVPSRTTMRLVEQVPCSRGARAYDCATYELTSAVEPDGLARLIDSSPPTGMRVDVQEFTTTVRVMLELDTMLPHQFEVTRRMRQTRERETVIRITDVERQVFRYTYVDEH